MASADPWLLNTRPRRPSSAAAAFDRADADRNGMLSPQEASTFPAIGERFQSLDKNQDKMLSREEFEAGAKS